MGLLVDGKWRDEWYDTKSSGGRFMRKPRTFRERVSADGSTPFPAEKGRYHLYVSLACPWAHRTLIFRRLKKLEEVISISVVNPLMGSEGWIFGGAEHATNDDVNGCSHLHQIYTRARRDYTGRVTVPVLWDKQQHVIVNNESSEIIRMLNSAFDRYAAPGDYYPAPLRETIDALNSRIYDEINDGVYRAGFATKQQVYDEAVAILFSALDWLDQLLSARRYLAGAELTEADWRLFPTLLRFDAVYHHHFKCNLRRIADYAHLSGYLRELYQWPGVAETVSFEHIKRHYFQSHPTINPTGIVPKGPLLDLDAPHGREPLS